EDGTGDVSGFIFAEEADDPRDLGCRAQSLNGDPIDNLLKSLFGHGGDHLSVDEPGRHAVDRNAPAGRLQCEALGEANQTRLGSRVVSLPNAASFADHGADVDNPAEAPLE